jgi:hypothetical protein
MRIWIAITIIITFAAAAAGCASSSVTEEYCNRADSCNILARSVEECIQDSDSTLAALPQNQRDEVEFEIKQCLDRPSCDGFHACVNDLGQ